MEQLKKVGEICRRHYEKIILILALLLLAGTVFYLASATEDEKEKLGQISVGYEKKSVKGLASISLSRFEQALLQMTNPPTLNFGGGHNLFNPVRWQMVGDVIQKVQKGDEVGVLAMRIVAIRPLFLTIAYDRPVISGIGNEAVVTGYHTVVTNELATPTRRRLMQFVSVNDTNKQVFVLREVKGPPEAPTELLATLKDYGDEKISFAPGKPYQRPIGYETDLKYPPTGKIYPRLRKDAPIEIDGEPYKIVDITQNKVVVSDDSNGKRYTIEQMVQQ